MSDLDLLESLLQLLAVVYVAALLAGKLRALLQCLSQERAGFNEKPFLHLLLMLRVKMEIHNLIGN